MRWYGSVKFWWSYIIKISIVSSCIFLSNLFDKVYHDVKKKLTKPVILQNDRKSFSQLCNTGQNIFKKAKSSKVRQN